MKRTLLLLPLAAIALALFGSCGGGGSSDAGPAPPTGDTPPATGGDTIPTAPTEAEDADAASGSPFDVATADAAPVDAAPADGAGDAAPPDDGKDDGPADQRPVGTGRDTSAIAGFWDYTRDTPDGTDVALFEISADGVVTEYDYDADDVGNGADCHRVTRAGIASRGDDRYDIQSVSSLPGSTGIDDVLITVEGGDIAFRYLGSSSDPQFGEGLVGVTERYPPADGTSDRLSVCED